MLLEVVLKVSKFGQVGLDDLRCRDSGPELDNPGEVLFENLVVLRGLLQCGKLGLKLDYGGLHLGLALVVRIFRLGLEFFKAGLCLLEILLLKLRLRDSLIAQVCAGAGLIEEVDSLVGKESVGYVAFGEDDSPVDKIVGYLNSVEVLIVALYTL